jgi:hypothetical protein
MWMSARYFSSATAAADRRKRAGGFAGKPSGVLYGLANVLFFQLGVGVEDVWDGHAGGELPQDKGDGDTEAA